MSAMDRVREDTYTICLRFSGRVLPAPVVSLCTVRDIILRG